MTTATKTTKKKTTKPKLPKTTDLVTELKTGVVYTLAKPEEAGDVKCPGDAHSNPYIDNCMICAPRWGIVMSYRPIAPSAVVPGVAVAFNNTGMNGNEREEHREAYKAAEAAGTIKLVMVEKKTRACTSSFFAYVTA